MPHRIEYRNIGQLLARLNTAEHEPAAAHISSADEFGGKDQPSAKGIK